MAFAAPVGGLLVFALVPFKPAVTLYALVFGLALALMLLWVARVARPYGFTREGILRAGRALGRHALIMGIIYAATLSLTMGAYLLFQRP